MAAQMRDMSDGSGLDDEGARPGGPEGAHIIPFMPARGAREPAQTPAERNQAELAPLVAAMAAGDEAALARLYDLTIARVYGLAYRVCGNAALAEEVASDVYYQCWNAAGRYDPSRSKVTTWLLMICRSRAIDAVRARDEAIVHDAPHALVDEEDQGRERDPQDLLELVQSAGALRTALAALTPVQRQMIGFAFFRGLSHQEIAVHAGLPLGTVKAHIRRALELLRRALPE